MTPRQTSQDPSVDDLVELLDDEAARRLLASAARSHDDVARDVRLATAGDDDRLTVLQSEVDHVLATRRHLDYWQSTAWASEASPVVDALEEAVAAGPSTDLVKLLERAIGHLVKVIMHADDSNGLIGDLTRQVLALHLEACEVGVADPVHLAKWMVRFMFVDQDFFVVDPVAYAGALGDKGLAAYRREVAKRSIPAVAGRDDPHSVDDLRVPSVSFAAKYAAERLAVVDRDADRLVELLGGDFSSPHQFLDVAEAMVEIDRKDDALAWARRGIAETSGWQLDKVYDLAAVLLAESGATDDLLTLRREQHHRTPSATTYTTLQSVARSSDRWDGEVAAARAVLAEREPAGLIDALLGDGDAEEAWQVANDTDGELRSPQWVRLAEAREPDHPADAMAVYLRLADEVLVNTDKRAYRASVGYLKAARRAAKAADRDAEFDDRLGALREQYRRRPSLIKMLDKARLR